MSAYAATGATGFVCAALTLDVPAHAYAPIQWYVDRIGLANEVRAA
ncbi:hypothetical protein ACFWF7_35075 [Nocardia sp. NPDC060256]